MKAPTEQPSLKVGGKVGSAENKLEQADMELKQFQAPSEVFLHLLHVITNYSFQPTCGAITVLDIWRGWGCAVPNQPLSSVPVENAPQCCLCPWGTHHTLEAPFGFALKDIVHNANCIFISFLENRAVEADGSLAMPARAVVPAALSDQSLANPPCFTPCCGRTGHRWEVFLRSLTITLPRSNSCQYTKQLTGPPSIGQTAALWSGRNLRSWLNMSQSPRSQQWRLSSSWPTRWLSSCRSLGTCWCATWCWRTRGCTQPPAFSLSTSRSLTLWSRCSTRLLPW